jgi:sec-independent protein translocase protein TatC
MRPPDDEARLEQSKMSFGEHLEELRGALFKSIIALICGFIVALIFGWQIVDYIQTPLRDALQRFYLRQAVENQQRWVREMQAHGEEVPEAFVKSQDELATEGLIPQRYYLSKEDLASLLNQYFPDAELAPAAAPSESRQPSPPAPIVGDANDVGDAEDSTAANDPGTPAATKFDRDEMISLRLYQPLEEDARMRVMALNSQEPFAVYIRTSFVAGALIASPFIFYFIWQFVAAGLYRQEQSYVYAYLPVSIGLFIAGALLAFYFAFVPLLDFLFWFFEKMHIDPGLRLTEWISFVLLLPLGFGASFQLPLIMLLLERIGIFTVDTYWRKWRAAVVVIAIIAMLLTPSPDPYSMLLMGIPLVGLYFAGIWMCSFMPGTSRRRRAGAPPVATGS